MKKQKKQKKSKKHINIKKIDNIKIKQEDVRVRIKRKVKNNFNIIIY
jgi:hypothetical protein